MLKLIAVCQPFTAIRYYEKNTNITIIGASNGPSFLYIQNHYLMATFYICL